MIFVDKVRWVSKTPAWQVGTAIQATEHSNVFPPVPSVSSMNSSASFPFKFLIKYLIKFNCYTKYQLKKQKIVCDLEP